MIKYHKKTQTEKKKEKKSQTLNPMTQKQDRFTHTIKNLLQGRFAYTVNNLLQQNKFRLATPETERGTPGGKN
jgi:hypothetical protein